MQRRPVISFIIKIKSNLMYAILYIMVGILLSIFLIHLLFMYFGKRDRIKFVNIEIRKLINSVTTLTKHKKSDTAL